MKFSSQEKSMYQQHFEPTPEERRELLAYLNFLFETDAHQKVLSDVRFAPAEIWKQWTDQSFIGFSSGKLMLQSGHPFAGSQLIEQPSTRENRSRLRQALGAFKGALQENVSVEMRSADEQWEQFRRIFPNASIPDSHTRWFRLHPADYFRMLEFYILKNNVRTTSPKRFLEIGAGAGVNIAFWKSLHPKMETMIIDLPETILVSYCFLKSVFPEAKIALPNKIGPDWRSGEYDVSYFLPYQSSQVPESYFDVACNMSSFQEMEPQVVDNYLALIAKRLVPGGEMFGLNHEVARHIPGNEVRKYDFSGFRSTPTFCDAPWIDHNSKSVQGLKHTFFHVEKSG